MENYNLKSKAISVVIEELKQRLTVKGHKIEMYSDRIKEYSSETNQELGSMIQRE